MYRWLILTVAAVPMLLSSFRTATPGLVWWTTHALEKIRPYDSIPADLNKSASVSAARNEFEAFQVVLRSETPISGIDVSLSDFTGPNGAVLSKQNAVVFFEGMLDLKKPSSIEGRPGLWPDPLIPRVDRYSNERRNSFPFDLTADRNQPIWIELYIPTSTTPGSYCGDVAIDVLNRRQVTIPVTLEIWNFTLPSTSSLPTSFGVNGLTAQRQHFGQYTNDDDVLKLTWIYQKALLWHRISVHGAAMAPPPFVRRGDRVEIDWRKYDEEVASFLDGTVFQGNEPLLGARATTIDLRTSGAANTDALKILYWREFARHFREKGWFDRLFNYVWDEPGENDFPAVLRKAQLTRTADPEIRNLVTAPLNPAWKDVIDLWSPLINCFERKAGHHPFCKPMADRDSYRPEEQNGKTLWWYQSCASHGCNTVGGEYFTGWPSYMIDISPVANRIMEWVTWKYGIQGELYFNTTEAFGKQGNPWQEISMFGGNGDGTLLYPGLPSRIGGRTHIPIESVRLKLIREGLEDYEYLHMLSRLGESSLAIEIVNTMVRKTYDFEHDPAKLYSARQRMGEELSRLGAGK